MRLYALGIRIASARNPKAKEWIDGRKILFEELQNKINPGDKIIWFHCASAGEFEQGKPVIEELKKFGGEVKNYTFTKHGLSTWCV